MDITRGLSTIILLFKRFCFRTSRTVLRRPEREQHIRYFIYSQNTLGFIVFSNLFGVNIGKYLKRNGKHRFRIFITSRGFHVSRLPPLISGSMNRNRSHKTNDYINMLFGARFVVVLRIRYTMFICM